MSGPRRHTIMGLLLLMCALTEHVCESAPSTVPVVRGEARPDLRRMQHIMRHVEDNRGRHHSAKTEAPALTESSSAEQRDFRNKADKGNQSVVIFPRDLRKKEKFIKHITGPLFFSPKCRKMVYRVYHHTRDCTIPACKHLQISQCHDLVTLSSITEISLLKTSKDVHDYSRGWQEAHSAQRGSSAHKVQLLLPKAHIHM
uniref:ALK and LTK ligand 2a n=1 Tax=Oryzias sinensis TaxID=183150 RepID=A0A8C7XI13_9TELE